MKAPNRTRVLIEDWMPIETLGAECMRERGVTSALPPLFFLHVWWARRPLAASRAAILASVLPAWSEDWPASLLTTFPTSESYKEWFLHLLGIFGDPARTRRAILLARKTGADLGLNPYGYKRAFTYNPDPAQLAMLRRLLKHAWGKEELSVLDPMAGGGSIPFESIRCGFTTFANDLNPVAALVEKATLDFPLRFGVGLAADIQHWGDMWSASLAKRLAPYYPKERDGQSVHAYIWARTVLCPSTRKPVPLAPNWWLVQKGGHPTCLRLIADPKASACSFEVVTGKEACRKVNPVDTATVRRGTGRSPWANWETIDEDYIKTEARAGRMGVQLCAAAMKAEKGFVFRSATAEDEKAQALVSSELTRRRAEWESKDLWPTEARSGGRSDFIGAYGFEDFASLFMPRQLLSLIVGLEEMLALQRRVMNEVKDRGRATAIVTYLSLAMSRAADYNSGQCHWDSTRLKSANTFSLHDFRIRWNPSEFDAARSLAPWAVYQVVDAYKKIAGLCPAGARPATLSCGDAARLRNIPDGSIDHVNVDPPYYYNVMYAECADFFYVWHKRLLREQYPELFDQDLTDKDSEAVANSARFREFGAKRDALADDDYERKILMIFREANRVLRPDGVMTVMFTNRQVRAWDALAYALIDSGFVVSTSWPVHTEGEGSLHIAKKNAAKSTILLACRKRDRDTAGTWWDDGFQKKVASTVRAKAAEYEAQGTTGVDLYLSTFGPVLHLISTAWPVKDPQGGDVIRPERALDLARQAVSEYRFERLCTSYRLDLEPVTRWTVLAWDIFRAGEFPFDEARKLALAVAGDVQVEVSAGARRKTTKRKDFLEGTILAQTGMATKTGESLKLVSPADRVKAGKVDLESDAFDHPIDALHAVIALHDGDGLSAVGKFLDRSGLARDKAFLGAFEALLHAMPPVRTEWKALEAVRQAHLTKKVKAPPAPENLELFPVNAGNADPDEGEGDDDTEDDGE